MELVGGDDEGGGRRNTRQSVRAEAEAVESRSKRFKQM